MSSDDANVLDRGVVELSHVGPRGAAMVDVGDKADTRRRAVAEARVRMRPETSALIREDRIAKGSVVETARLAGIMAAKRTAELIPLCHPLPLTNVSVDLELLDEPPCARITASARCVGKTGVEMEALTAASVAALTIYDMCKAVDREMVIEGVRLLEKAGGRSGHYLHPDRAARPKSGTVVALSISERRGEKKGNVTRARFEVDLGLAGDAHAGFGHRQVSLLAAESVDSMRARGVAVKPGDFAENVTTSGLAVASLPVGTRLRLGDQVELEVTQIGKECHSRCEIFRQVGDCVMPREGIFAKVLRGGDVQPGDEVVVL